MIDTKYSFINRKGYFMDYQVTKNGKVVMTGDDLNTIVDDLLSGDISLITYSNIIEWLEDKPVDEPVLRKILKEMESNQSEYAYWIDNKYFIVPIEWAVKSVEDCLNTFDNGYEVE